MLKHVVICVKGSDYAYGCSDNDYFLIKGLDNDTFNLGIKYYRKDDDFYWGSEKRRFKAPDKRVFDYRKQSCYMKGNEFNLIVLDERLYDTSEEILSDTGVKPNFIIVSNNEQHRNQQKVQRRKKEKTVGLQEGVNDRETQGIIVKKSGDYEKKGH